MEGQVKEGPMLNVPFEDRDAMLRELLAPTFAQVACATEQFDCNYVCRGGGEQGSDFPTRIAQRFFRTRCACSSWPAESLART
eukprot:9530230-Alexandrium_andersonii.AAC.1